MFSLFATSLAGGMLVALGTGRLAETSAKYVRLVGGLSLALTALVTASALLDPGAGSVFPPPGGAAGWIPLIGSALCGVGAAGVVVQAPAVMLKTIPLRVSAWIGGAAGIISACATVHVALALDVSVTDVTAAAAGGLVAPDTPLMATLRVLSLAGGSLLLGSVTVAWLLGHAYLTATEMTLAPLRRFGRVLGAAYVLRLALAALVFALIIHHARASGASLTITLLGAHGALPIRGIALLVRWLVGLLVPGVFTWMVMDCIRLRSTQSATGLLYFNSALIYFGELASQYLLMEMGWPL